MDLLREIEERGGQYVFITNNSSKSVEDYIEKVRAMGIQASYENFYTIDTAEAEAEENTESSTSREEKMIFPEQ